MHLDPMVRDATVGGIEKADRPADTAHLADADEVGLPDVVAREAALDRRTEVAARRVTAAADLHVAEVILVKDHAVVFESETTRQLGVRRHLFLIDLAVGEDRADA